MMKIDLDKISNYALINEFMTELTGDANFKLHWPESARLKHDEILRRLHGWVEGEAVEGEAGDDPQFWYFTFGQGHAHRISGKTFDCDTIMAIYGRRYEARSRMFDLCGDKWANQYSPLEIDCEDFPKGVCHV